MDLRRADGRPDKWNLLGNGTPALSELLQIAFR
jgi:hypothetical protein